MTVVVDKNIVKEALRELIHEEPDTFKKLLKEILAEQTPSEEDDFERLLQKNFQRFDATFRALA
jgi:hypothetical protein